MSHVVHYDGQFFRIEIAEVAKPDEPDKAVYAVWSSNAFKELQDAPSQALSRFMGTSPVAKYPDALRYAFNWIKTDWDAQHSRQPDKPDRKANVLYTVWLFQRDDALECDFEEFSDAKAFAKAAENIAGIKKVGITNNESPQYLTLWEKGS